MEQIKMSVLRIKNSPHKLMAIDIQKHVLEDFDAMCKDIYITRSRLVRDLMVAQLNSYKRKKKQNEKI